MKIIIAYASAGSGHFKAAEALCDYFKSNHPDIDVQSVDVLDKSNLWFKAIYSKGYNFLIFHMPWLWSLLFRITFAPRLRRAAKLFSFPFDLWNTRRFCRFLREESPEVVVSTHFLVSEMTSYLRGRGLLNAKLVTVITDFGVHPFWVHPHTDAYVVASSHTRDDLIASGVSDSVIKILGIPIAEKFSRKRDRKSICAKLGISGDVFTVLLITGSFGLGPLEEIAELLYRDVQVLVVCAQNKSLYARLSARVHAQVKVFGFINYVEDLMTVSDLIITKPGGLTVSETLSMDLPPLFISAIFGQETENARIVSLHKAGITVNRIGDIRDIVLDFKNHPEKLLEFKSNIAGIKKPFAARDVGEYILALSS